jgi:hypothetical protein
MTTISFARHQFPPAVIRHAVWLYARFTLSYRDVEELLAERGLDISYETVRRWVLKFGPLFARELRRRRFRPTSQWHLDEMAAMICGKQFWLWRAVDSEGEVLDLLAHVAPRPQRRQPVRKPFPAPLPVEPLRPNRSLHPSAYIEATKPAGSGGAACAATTAKARKPETRAAVRPIACVRCARLRAHYNPSSVKEG